MRKQYVYKVEDIFEDIPDDPKNVNMTIPPEIMEQIGITTGDTVKISYGDQGSLIIEKVDKKENSGEEDQEEQE